jgi:transcription initiation factor TFIID TATA-box-binding protein
MILRGNNGLRLEKVVSTADEIEPALPDKPKITVQNIVASGSIKLNLNLNYLALQLENTEYEPEQFPGLVYKLVDPTATFLLFSNGKLVCTGTKNKQQPPVANGIKPIWSVSGRPSENGWNPIRDI